MIFPIAPIYGFFFRSIPIFEPVQDVHTDLSATLVPAVPPDPGTPSLCLVESVETRWVLKGYEWRPVAVWYPMVNPGWDACVDNDPAEIHERSVREEEARAARRNEPPEPSRRDPVQRLEPDALQALRALEEARRRCDGAPGGGAA